MWTLSSMFLVATKVWKDNYKQKMNNKQGEIQSNNYQQCSFFKYMSKFMVKGTIYRRTKRLHKNIGSTYDSIS